MLKFFSTKELNIDKHCKNGLREISKLSIFNKFSIYFWLIGPFIYLIERDPADLWLTLLSITFLARCYIIKEWSWVKQWWFKISLIFWLYCLINAFFSPYLHHSLIESIVWIRFPLYVAAAQAWLGKKYEIRILMFVSIFVCMILMCIILGLEIIIDPKYDHRLTWPYGDHMPGSYLSKISLQVYCIILVIFFNRIHIKNIFLGIIAFLSLTMIFLTGERMNFFIRLGAGFLSIFCWNFKIKKAFFLLSIIFILIVTLFFIHPPIKTIYKTFIDKIPITNMEKGNPYWESWRGGLQQGIENPIIGLGVASHRIHCSTMNSHDIKWLPGKNICVNHPHNFYIQLFAETGLVGLIFGTLMIFFILKSTFNSRKFNPTCPISSTAFIVPLLLFFPIQQTGNFFGQWGNLFIWFSIGYAMTSNQTYDKSAG